MIQETFVDPYNDKLADDGSVWNIEMAKEDPFHFLHFLTPSARVKFGQMMNNKTGTTRRQQTLNKLDNKGNENEPVKHLYSCTLSNIELDKFDAKDQYPDLKVFTVFCVDKV